MIGYEFILMFNPQVLECVSVESGNENMLENTERMSAPVEPIIENEEGKVVFAMASIAMGDVPGAYGNGQLASLQWRRKAAGPYNFFLSSIEVLKPNAVPSDMIIEGPFTVAEKVSIELVNVDISRVGNHITASFENVVDDEDDVQLNVLISDNPNFESSEQINEEPLDIQGRSNQFEFDLELDPNTTYYYRIQKVSKTGNVMYESPVYEEVIPPGKCEESIRGDLNNNCKLELSDLIQLLQILSGIDIEPVNQ
ncbi:MAG: hypothetical protein OMM_04042 [Candidatus Magnetoglobus multicellularis str. Araruama]|uniref:Fibronectin type-III domain-containing protein n=1 Tax=Candidatus Magnetoglobus multicellularis str. Araruama TaxID=890399 RepID=A0A1V1P3F3_9BACT|nr:MAG: hypothetical protein OMM_04042 [Candidatus Magnetoglobus multicellularis str. Araruama]